MLRPFFLTRASIGLAATAVEQVVDLPSRAAGAVAALPQVPVRIAGGLVQSYLHAGQQLTELAVKGDSVLASVFPMRTDQPEWATFDEDEADSDEVLDVDYTVHGRSTDSRSRTGYRPGSDSPDVPSGRVTRRDS